tara:strand:- start:828 stop:1673 length:846 start_codon:yes stop_codon:yes gene_type:complete
MKKIIGIILIIVLISCEREAIDGIPSYIKIENINLIDTTDYNNGFNTENITDAWVSINGIDKGIYELPTTFPVLDNGPVEVRVYAGIKDNGIAAQRKNYPFYNSYTENTILVPDSITKITPQVSVKENINGQFDDFDNSFSFNYDSCCFAKIANGPYENYGSLTLSDSILITEIKYQDQTLSFNDVPQQGSPAYIELDYKNNTRFLVGIYINFTNSPTVEKGLLWVSPKDSWHKIYVNITETLTEAVGAEDFSLFIRMLRDDELEENKLDFDNIRIIHYEK